MSISPWGDVAEIQSPDGRVTASILDAEEIAMGAPTSGELRLSNGMRRDNCNPSIVWSDDSRFLAVPQWTSERMQRLMIIDVEGRQSRYAPGTFSVLELDTFKQGVVSGVDSPIYMPQRIEIDTHEIEW